MVLKDEEAESKKQIEEAFATSGLKVPALNEVLAGLKIDKARAPKNRDPVLRDKVLIKISKPLGIHPSALESYAAPSLRRKPSHRRSTFQRSKN